MCTFQDRWKNKISFLFYFLNAYRPIDEKKFRLQNFNIISVLFLKCLPTCRLKKVLLVKFYFRPTDCTKKAREKSANQRINRPWPEKSGFVMIHATCCSINKNSLHKILTRSNEVYIRKKVLIFSSTFGQYLIN